ncbi:MAG: hypothetical protein NVSMB24_26010 [Mucilaginibacter sp.]
MNYKQAIYVLYAMLFLYFIIAAVTLISSSQSGNWDTSLCLKMTDNAYKHIPFNYYAHPNPKNLNEDQYEFVTWWSPGQFALPLIIEKYLDVKLAVALKLLTMLCLVISAWGIFLLYKQLLKNKATQIAGESVTAVGLACVLFVITLPFFWGNLNVYDGGGILLLAYCPWFIYWLIKCKGITVLNILILLISGLIGFFLKSSFTSVFIGALLYLFLANSIFPFTTLKGLDVKKIIVNALYLGGALIIYILIIKVAFLSHNRGISNSSTGFRMQPRVLFFPMDAPVLSLFSLDHLNKTYQWIIASVFILPCYYLLLKSEHITPIFKNVLVSFVGGCIGFYLLMYFLNYDVSYELRHFRIATILFVPALYISFSHLTGVKYIFYGVMILYFGVNIYSYIENLVAAKAPGPLPAISGLPASYPAELLNKIHHLDSATGEDRDIFYFKSYDPAIALEIKNSRVLFEDNFINFHFDNQLRFNRTLYWGTNSGQIYIVYPLAEFKKDSALYLTRFEKYKKFKSIYQIKGFTILKAIEIENK